MVKLLTTVLQNNFDFNSQLSSTTRGDLSDEPGQPRTWPAQALFRELQSGISYMESGPHFSVQFLFVSQILEKFNAPVINYY